HWDPPPQMSSLQDVVLLLDVLEVALKSPPPPWASSLYEQKLHRFLEDGVWYGIHDRRVPRTIKLLQRLPQGPDLARKHFDSLQSALFRWMPDDSFDDATFVATRGSLHKWLQDCRDAAP